MGATESKMEGIQSTEAIGSGNPNITFTPSQQIRRLEIDPRSPTIDILRTPIEVLKTPVQPTSTPVTTPNMGDVINPIEDPRSPTVEFNRTPIIVINPEKKPLTLHNKILDKARIPQLVPTPAKAKRESKFAKMPEACKLVESNTTIQPLENKRNSIVGLLETNIDFIETDLDAVIQNRSINLEREGCKSFVETTSTINKVDVNKSLFNLIKDEQIAEDVEIDEIHGIEVNVSTVDENLIPIRTENNVSSVAELSRKLTNLIYEDKLQLDESPAKSSCFVNHRTPLHDQNPNSQICRSIPVLKVSDKPTKAPKSGSKIPVFKDRKIKGKKNVQCENTPPRMKAKPSQWAAEDSMII